MLVIVLVVVLVVAVTVAEPVVLIELVVVIVIELLVGNQQFLPFPQCFLTLSQRNFVIFTFKLSSVGFESGQVLTFVVWYGVKG